MSESAIRLTWRSCIGGVVVLVPMVTQAQTPIDSGDGPPTCSRSGRLHRFFHHSAHTLQDKWIGYPENFAEPPLGHYINEQFTVQVAKADQHRFMLYHSDFLPGTNLFSPVGASRYNIMTHKMPGWLGPITIEWTPGQPELAESRRRAVMEVLLNSSQPALAQRVVIAPSPYPGTIGFEPINNYNNMTTRSQLGAQGFVLPPERVSLSGSAMK